MTTQNCPVSTLFRGLAVSSLVVWSDASPSFPAGALGESGAAQTHWWGCGW